MKPYIEVEEEHTNEGVNWGICLGSPNPDSGHYIKLSKEKAFELKEKLNKFLEESLEGKCICNKHN